MKNFIDTEFKKGVIFFLVVVSLLNCTPVKLSTTKLYKVTNAQKFGKHTQVRIQGLPGYFMLNSDTLKVNDSIEITVFKRNRKSK